MMLFTYAKKSRSIRLVALEPSEYDAIGSLTRKVPKKKDGPGASGLTGN